MLSRVNLFLIKCAFVIAAIIWAPKIEAANLYQLDDPTICRFASNERHSGWESDERYQSHVREAKRRNLSIEKCNVLLGHNRPSGNSIVVSMDEQTLCRFSLNSSHDNWETDVRYQSHVEEAQSRNLTILQCNNLLGRNVGNDSELSELRQEINNLKDELIERNDKIDSLQKELERSRKEIDSLKSQILNANKVSEATETASVKKSYEVLDDFEGTWASTSSNLFHLVFSKGSLGSKQVSIPNIGQATIGLSDGQNGSNFLISAPGFNCYYFVSFVNSKKKLIMEFKSGGDLCVQSSVLEKTE